MINLAGVRPDLTDEIIRHELNNAGIPVIELPTPSMSEVRYSLIGQLKPDYAATFTFTRLWYYWAATGPVPLALAEELYRRDPDRQVRAGGCAGGDLPTNQAYRGFVEVYHIDSALGLKLFADLVQYSPLRKNF